MDLPPQFKALAETRNGAADDLLLAAVSELDRPYNEWAVDVLLARGHDAALGFLLEKYHELPETCRRRIAEQAESMQSALRAGICSPLESTRLNIVDLTARRNSPALSYLLNAGLNNSLPTIRKRAALVLRDMALRFAVTDAGTEDFSPIQTELQTCYKNLAQRATQRTRLIGTLRQALHDFDVHRRAAVLEAVAWFSLEMEDDIQTESRKPGSKFWRTICEMICSDPKPCFAALALQALAEKETRPLLVQVLSKCQNDSFMTAIMERSWLVCDPRIREGCFGIQRLAWLEHRPGLLLDMPLGRLLKTMRFLRATGIADEVRLAWSRSLTDCGQIDRQVAGLWELISIKDDASSDVLRVLSEWADPEIAALARRELFQRNPNDPRLQNIKRHSTHRPHRSLVPPDHCDFDWLQREYDFLDEGQRSAIGRGLLSAGFDMAGRLSSMLTSSNPVSRVRAIEMIRALGLEDRLKQHVMAAAEDSDCVVRSAAIRALARLQDRDSQRILLRALGDSDRRTRANAIDALDELSARDCVDKIIPCLSDPDHRVRAAAVRALLKLRVRKAAQTLLDLLRDPSKAHRLSGLWVVERYGLTGTLKQIAELAEDDPDETVRRRARRLLRAQRRATHSRTSLPDVSKRGPQN